ncbi:hypothetical protein JCM10908_004289 [Rhodotorula pacifica]|uniref:uncharacterized protein n=1 Tax=Rhodotorula pacifica TaxID=1495444 RepID=UPI0031773EF4
MRPAPGLVASLREVISRTAATTSRGGASKLVRPAVKVHPPAAAPHQIRHASTAAPSATAWRAAVEAIYAGTFKAIRSGVKVHHGPYSGPRAAPRPSATSPFSTFAQASVRRAPRSHFGPRPRPVAVSGPGHVGLGSARQFSSSGHAVFDNVMANAPLALRALADEGLDQRKRKRVRREVSKKERAVVKGKGKVMDSRLLTAEKRAEFEHFFGAAAASATASHAASATEESTLAEPVTLILAVDPELDLPVNATECGSSSPAPAPERILSPHLLSSFETITQAYTAHSHRLQAIVNRLSAAGLLDPEIDASTFVGTIRMSDGLDFEHVGRRVWKITFHDGLVTRSRVEQVVRVVEMSSLASGATAYANEEVPPWARKVRSWTGRNSVTAGEGDWWWLTGGEAPVSCAASPHEALSPLPTATPSLATTSNASVDDEAARLVADTFLLPDPPAFAFEFDLADHSPTSSPASSVDSDDLDRDVWAGFTSASPSVEASAASVADQAGFETLDPAATAWLEAVDESSDVTGDLLSSEDDERSGLERFLEEVEVLQQRSSRVCSACEARHFACRVPS